MLRRLGENITKDTFLLKYNVQILIKGDLYAFQKFSITI